MRPCYRGRMWSSLRVLMNYGEVIGTMVLAAALADWSLNDEQRGRLARLAGRMRVFATDLRRRWLLDKFCHPQLQRNFIATVFLADALLVSYLARRVDYRGTNATAADVLLGDLLLFIVPLCIAAYVLVRAGPRLIALLVGRHDLPACLGKCVAAALAAGALAYGALQVMNATFLAFGPRALLDWWDVRLSIYAAEYALSGVIVSAAMIANLLAVICAAAGMVSLAITLVLMQAELLARLIARYPKGALLGSSIAVAGLAIVLKDWV